MKFRKFFSFFVIVCILLAPVILFTPPLLIIVVKKSTTAVFPGAKINIKSCSIWPPGSLSCSGISIQKGGVYRFLIASVGARVSVFGGIREISAQVPELAYGAATVKNLSINCSVLNPGMFAIEKLSAGKLIVSDITAKTAFDNNMIRLENLSAHMLGGFVKGKAAVVLNAGMPYRGEIHVSALDMSVFISDFSLGEKLQLSGRIEGDVQAQGSAGGLAVLSGNLKALSPGGVLNIRDQATIDMIAQRSGQARDLISRSFTDYRYDQAQALLSTEANKLVLAVSFQGENGTRILNVVLHDFKGQGGEQ
jgi:hypothetical protein